MMRAAGNEQCINSSETHHTFAFDYCVIANIDFDDTVQWVMAIAQQLQGKQQHQQHYTVGDVAAIKRHVTLQWVYWTAIIFRHPLYPKKEYSST